MRLPTTTRAGAAGSRCLLKFARSPSLLRDFTRRKREKERDDLSLTCDGSAQGRRVKYFVFYAIEKYVRVRKKVRGRRCCGRMPSRRSMPVVTRVPCHCHGIAPDDVSVATVAVAMALLPSVSLPSVSLPSCRSRRRATPERSRSISNRPLLLVLRTKHSKSIKSKQSY